MRATKRSASGGRARKTVLAAALVVSLIAAAGATAITLKTGELVVRAEGSFAPKTLPRHRDAPITLHGSGTISTSTGALPPILRTLTFDFDRHGSVQTSGLPVCTIAKLRATTTARARRDCPRAIVGKGYGKAVVKFPEQAPIPVSTPLTVFNGPPKGGDPTMIVHAFLTVPAPTTYLVPVVIERIRDGIYGYRIIAKIPSIAGGNGVPVAGSLKFDRKWSFHGRQYSYVNARCETGHLQARGEFDFSDGTQLIGTFIKPCEARE